jgi:predicted O-linked N-acetylglucosamine transferase (SPINDLY family)
MASPAQAQAAATLLRDGVAHHQAGRLREAEALYQRALELHPGQPDALNLIGLIQHQRGRTATALARFDEALAIAPSVPEYHNNRGMALSRLGRLDEAIAALRVALGLRKNYAEAQYNLGNALRAKGDTAAACEAYRAAVALHPGFHDAHVNLGNLLAESGDPEAGIRHLERAAALRPPTAEALNNLAVALIAARRLDEAEGRLREAVTLRPDFAAAHINLGRVYGERQDSGAALASLETAVRLKPDDAAARCQLGILLHAMKRHDDAVEQLRAAAVARPQDKRIQLQLGRVLDETSDFSGAAAAFRTALQVDPDNAEARVRLGRALLAGGRVEESIMQFESVVAGPQAQVAASNRLLALNYNDGASAEAVAAAHREFGRALEESIEPLPAAAVDRSPDRRLRVGYLSDDFRWHSCAFFAEPLLAAHDRSAVEVFCYSATNQPDAITARLRGHGHGWRDVGSIDDRAVAGQVRADGIDILVDLGGHTGGSRLGVFAMKPAPIQVTWLGYPNTTGLSRIDYRLSDAVADPPGAADALCTERLVRLPGVFLCYRPPAEAPAVEPLPAEAGGTVTFASFNNVPKIGPSVVALWASILGEVPGSRLLMKSKALADEEVRVRYRKLFARHGIAPERIGMFPFVEDLAGSFALHRAVDIGLDAFPYNGTTSTCDALWMGVPVVTLRGDRHAGRVGATLLQAVGLDECTAGSPEAYRAGALALARDLPRLAALRQGLRARVAASPLRDEAGFARAVEQAYREMWRGWCAAPA